MSVQVKLVAGFAVVVVIFTGLAAYHLSVIRGSARTSHELQRLGGRLEATSARHLRLLDRVEESASKYWVTRDSGYAVRYAAARDSVDAMIRTLGTAPLTDRERTPVQRLQAAWADGEALPDSLPDRLSGLPAATASDSLEALRGRVTRLRGRTRAVNRASRAAIRTRVDAAARAVERAETFSWIALVAGLFAAGVVSVWVVRSILRGLGRLRAGTRAVADGDFGHRIRIEKEDEFGELGEAFNEMTARLGEVDRLKRNFLSQVSHDLKTPLASVRETVRLLLDEVPGELNSDQRRLLEMSHRSSERLSTMIDRLLDLARMEADAVSYELEPVDLGELAREVAEEFRPRLRDGARTLEVEVGDGAGGPTAAVDRSRTVQVLQNLLDNALEHTPEEGRIRLEVEGRDEPPEVPDWAAGPRPGSGAGSDGRHPGLAAGTDDGGAEGGGSEEDVGARGDEPGRWVLLSVADDGPGVDPDERSAVFERFRQAGSRGSSGGVGLGLTLCREIVEAHGGAIWVEESASGGSRFRVLLPAEPPGGAAAAAEGADAAERPRAAEDAEAPSAGRAT